MPIIIIIIIIIDCSSTGLPLGSNRTGIVSINKQQPGGVALLPLTWTAAYYC